MIIEPMDDFWKQMLDELNNTTEEEWTQHIVELLKLRLERNKHE